MTSSLSDVEAAIANSPGGCTRFFDMAEFPWVKRLEASWLAMRAEVDVLLDALDLLPGYEDIQIDQRQLSTDKRWKIFPLYVHGYDLTQCERRCPASIEAIRHIPGLKVAMFSILQAGKALPPHRGPYSGVLRYHLGLKVPKPETQCGISVGGDVAHWREGESLIFDDTHLHHAWNHSQEERVVLFVDFVRPLPEELAILNDRVIAEFGESEFITSAVRNWQEWELLHGVSLDRIVQGICLDRAALTATVT